MGGGGGFSLTFDKQLSGAFLLSDHAAVRRVISQGAVVDGEVAHVPDALKDVPGQEEERVYFSRRGMKLPARFVPNGHEAFTYLLVML